MSGTLAFRPAFRAGVAVADEGRAEKEHPLRSVAGVEEKIPGTASTSVLRSSVFALRGAVGKRRPVAPSSDGPSELMAAGTRDRNLWQVQPYGEALSLG